MPQPWPFFFLATFLAAFFFFLAMDLAPSKRAPGNKAHVRSQGRSHDGIERRHQRAKNRDCSWFPHDDVHVVKDAPENCQEKFPNFFGFFSLRTGA
jgi:hypothetical protein